MNTATTQTRPPLIAPTVEKVPPRVLREKLRADETLVWWSRGSGNLFDLGALLGVVSTFVASLFLLGMSWLLDWSISDSWFFLFPVFVVNLWGLIIVFVIGARLQLYALTDRRVICVPGFPYILSWSVGGDPYWWSASKNKTLGGGIYMLRVTGTRKRGHVRLQGLYRGTFSLVTTYPLRLSGIDTPLEVAALIKSTLNLSLPIEDRTR